MQTRTITVDYARPRGYDVGYRAENNFTLLALPVPAELKDADSYRVYFESTVGEYLQTELLTPADGYVTVKITSDIVPEPGNMAAQLVAFADGEIVGYAPMITGSAKVSIPDGTERLSHSLAAEIALNTAARHKHDNKSVLDKFSESDGKPTYDGKAAGGAWYVDIAQSDNAVTANKTAAEVYAAYEAGYSVYARILINNMPYAVPLKTAVKIGDAITLGFSTSGAIDKLDVLYPIVIYFSDVWSIQLLDLKEDLLRADQISWEDSNVAAVLDVLRLVAHNHSNKEILDKLSASDGKLRYDGKDIGGGDSGTFTVEMTLTESFELESCEVTFSQVDSAYKAGKDLVIKCEPFKLILPLFQAAEGIYVFGLYINFQTLVATIDESGWKVSVNESNAVYVGYENEALPDATSVKDALDALVPAQVTTGTNITLADNTEYRLADVTTLTLAYPTGNFECWLRLTFAASGDITVTLPSGTGYIGSAPDFKNGEIWELSFKDKILAAQKVGEGS